MIKKNTELSGEDVLVGECEGLSAIFTVAPSSAMPGLLVVETEHGSLYLDPDESSTVLGYNGIYGDG
jgi:hypothetical protein